MGGWQRVDGEVVIRRGQDGQKDGMVGETLGLQLDGLTPARKQQTQSWREQRLVFLAGGVAGWQTRVTRGGRLHIVLYCI